MPDITAIGEILIDLTQTGTDERGVPQFAANPGGAPANLAVAASRLGASTAFIGRVGQDSFGDELRRVLAENGVDVSALLTDPTLRTTLAVVSVDRTGERDFCFYRDPSADVNLSPTDVPEALLEASRILHFGSVSLTAEPARSATLHAVRRARAMGRIISYDPNYRARLWPDEATAIAQMKAPLPLVDILKVSDEELPLLSGTDDLTEGSHILAEAGVSLILVTLGAEGAFYRFGDRTGHLPGVPCRVGDTNGAGDTFFGALLAMLCRYDSVAAIPPDALESAIAFANRAASITASRHGAIPAMPTLAEVEAPLRSSPACA